jgi:hypothetical protein
MNKANYIIFHPDNARQRIAIQATSLTGNKIKTNWTGDIFVDKIGEGNEDPFVFNNPWIYSYCHASQLRRKSRKDIFLQKGSILLFTSGQQADNRKLVIDTIFVIDGIHEWNENPLQLPLKYRYLNSKRSDKLWKRHFSFPFQGQHSGVTHSYEAELWQKGKDCFSFLPLDINGEKVSVPIDNFPTTLLKKVLGNVKGKYPVLLSDKEMETIIKQVDSLAKIKVLKDIISNNAIVTSTKIKC